MNLRKATKYDIKAIRRLYGFAFPRNERVPFFLLRRKATQNKAEMLVADDEDGFIGFVYSGTHRDIVYMFYFAVDEAKRGSGNGSEMLRLLKAYYFGKKIFLAREPLDETAANSKERIDRRSFYLRNGFFDLPYAVSEAGLTFEVMSTSEAVSPTDYNALVRNWAGKLLLSFIKYEACEKR